MRFRKNLFTVLALVALLWMIYGFSVTGRVASNQFQSEPAQTSAAYQAGTTIGAGIATSFVLCTGAPLLFLFALLAWRNGVGLTSKKRHEETIAALKSSAGHGANSSGA